MVCTTDIDIDMEIYLQYNTIHRQLCEMMEGLDILTVSQKCD